MACLTFVSVVTGLILTKVGDLFRMKERGLKCAFCWIGSKAVAPCDAYDVACMLKNPFYTDKMQIGKIPRNLTPGVGAILKPAVGQQAPHCMLSDDSAQIGESHASQEAHL